VKRYIHLKVLLYEMSEEGKKSKEISGLIFVACMFIGGGIGLLFGRPDVGGAIGMGVGFFLMAVTRGKRIESSKVVISLPRTFGQMALCLIGALMITFGFFIFYHPELLYPYLIGAGVILIGVLIFLAGLIGIRLGRE